MKLRTIFFGSLFLISIICSAQPVPAGDENIPYLMTFGNKAETSWGDDDFSQTFFFLQMVQKPVAGHILFTG